MMPKGSRVLAAHNVAGEESVVHIKTFVVGAPLVIPAWKKMPSPHPDSARPTFRAPEQGLPANFYSANRKLAFPWFG